MSVELTNDSWNPTGKVTKSAHALSALSNVYRYTFQPQQPSPIGLGKKNKKKQ